MRKPVFCIYENNDADQLRGNSGEVDQRLCFRYTDSTIPLLLKSGISILQPSYAVVQPGLCRIRSETPMTGFLKTCSCFMRKVENRSKSARFEGGKLKLQKKNVDLDF